MTIMRSLKKGTNPPGVGGGIMKVKDKCIDQRQWEDTSSKVTGLACGKIRQFTRNLPMITDAETMNEVADGIKKLARPQLFEGGVKEKADEGEYNHFTILRIGYLCYCVSLFHHVNLSLISASFIHICYTISPY